MEDSYQPLRSGLPKAPNGAPVSRLAVHTMTTKPLPLPEAVAAYAERGIGGISVWVESLEGVSPERARRLIDEAGLSVPALVRGGFFCHSDPRERLRRIDACRDLLHQAAVLGAGMLVLVVGACPGQPLKRQREWVRAAIEALLPTAERTGVRLAIEPLHPMYAADKSCLNRLSDSRRICENIDHPAVGVAVDVYHVWWDPDLMEELTKLGQQGRIFAFHLCDWRVPTRDLLTDRALMGDGCIDLVEITRAVQATGFDGWHEVEIFSQDHWQQDQREYLDQIVQRYKTLEKSLLRD